MSDLRHPCEHWAEPISLAAAGCLSSDEELKVRRHAETCADCGEQFRQLTELCRALAEAPLATDSTEAAIVERIMSAVTAQVSRRPIVRTGEEIIHPTLLSRSPGTRRWVMRSPVFRISAAAILALTIVGIGVWFHSGGATPAFGNFIEPILSAKTVTFKTTVEVEGQKVTGKVMAIASPQRVRLEQDLPNEQKMVTISDETSNLVLRPAEKVAIVATITNDPKEKRSNAVFFELRSQLADAGHQPDWIRESLGEKVIDGQRLAGYRLTGHGMIWELWGDPKTRLPVRIESSAPSNPNVRPMIYSDFVFNAHLDESLFSMEPPAGYQVQKQTVEPSTTITSILALPPQVLDPDSKDQTDAGDNSEPVPPQSQPLFRDDFSDLTNCRSRLSDGKVVRDGKPTRATWPFAAFQFKGRLALIISELPEAVGADRRPGVLRVEWEHVPEEIGYSGFRYEGRSETARRLMLPQIMTARNVEELRGFKFRAKFKAENENLGDEAKIKFDLRIEPVEDQNYDNRLDFGTIEASSTWKTFEIDLADAKNGERFIEMFARRGTGLCTLVVAQAGSIEGYHDGDGLLIDDIEILDCRNQ
jgi:outer membrane lipoprotein-sorting protein